VYISVVRLSAFVGLFVSISCWHLPAFAQDDDRHDSEESQTSDSNIAKFTERAKSFLELAAAFAMNLTPTETMQDQREALDSLAWIGLVKSDSFDQLSKDDLAFLSQYWKTYQGIDLGIRARKRVSSDRKPPSQPHEISSKIARIFGAIERTQRAAWAKGVTHSDLSGFLASRVCYCPAKPDRYIARALRVGAAEPLITRWCQSLYEHGFVDALPNVDEIRRRPSPELIGYVMPDSLFIQSASSHRKVVNNAERAVLSCKWTRVEALLRGFAIQEDQTEINSMQNLGEENEMVRKVFVLLREVAILRGSQPKVPAIHFDGIFDECRSLLDMLIDYPFLTKYMEVLRCTILDEKECDRALAGLRHIASSKSEIELTNRLQWLYVGRRSGVWSDFLIRDDESFHSKVCVIFCAAASMDHDTLLRSMTVLDDDSYPWSKLLGCMAKSRQFTFREILEIDQSLGESKRHRFSFVLGNARLRQHDFSGAEAAFRCSLQSSPFCTETMALLSRSMYRRGDEKAACSLANGAVDLGNSDLFSNLLFASNAFRRGEYGIAYAELFLAESRGRKNPELLTLFREVEASMGQHKHSTREQQDRISRLRNLMDSELQRLELEDDSSKLGFQMNPFFEMPK
jgi:hypothetical protein